MYNNTIDKIEHKIATLQGLLKEPNSISIRIENKITELKAILKNLKNE